MAVESGKWLAAVKRLKKLRVALHMRAEELLALQELCLM